MRITESKLRSIIRQVILESDGMGDLEDPSVFGDFLDALEKNGFDPEILTVNESNFRRKRLIKESFFKYKNWSEYLKDLEKKNIDLDAQYESLSEEDKEKVRSQAAEIRAAKGNLKAKKINEVIGILGGVGALGAGLMVLITFMCALPGLIPTAVGLKIMSVIGGKTILGLFGVSFTALAGSESDTGVSDDIRRSEDPESPLSDKYL